MSTTALLTLLVVCLALALLLALKRVADQNRVVRQIIVSIQRRHSFLRERENGLLGDPHWTAFYREINGLIEDRNRLHRDRAGQVGQLQTTLQNIQEAVLIINAENEIVLANAACRKIFPHRDNLAGRRVETVFESGPFVEYVREVVEGKGERLREISFASPDGPVWTEVTGSPIPAFQDSDPALYLYVFHDITRLKRLETVRKEFVSNVSHELRTPLSMIKGYVETLTDEEQEITEGDRQRFLRIIQKHTDRLNLLIEDLLALSRLEGREPEVKREDVLLEPMIADLVADFADAVKAHGQNLSLALETSPVPVSADVAKISQVFQNLLGNAVKYSPEGASIEIGTRAVSDHVVVWVKDTGVGIEEHDLRRIFERFYRVDKGRSREKGGTGLGLSIVKHIVQLHGGRVWAESRVGEGTTFFFTLPRAITS